MLVISRPVILTHVFHHPHFGRYFALHRPSLGQERLNLRAVLLNVEIVNVLDAVDIERWRLMQIAIVTKMPSIVVCLGKPLMDRLGQHSKNLSSIFF